MVTGRHFLQLHPKPPGRRKLGEGEEASNEEVLPSNSMVTGRHFLRVPPELPGRRREATLPDEEGPIEPATSEDSRATPLQGFFS